MTDPDHPTTDEAALQREAMEWVIHLTSGNATAGDASRLNRWRAETRAHRKAFAEANLLWDRLGAAATVGSRAAGARRTETPPGTHDPAAGPSERWLRRSTGRRAVLGGALAAAAAAVGYVVVRPPLHLWPSVAELAADYRTGTGEQRHITVGSGVSVSMNTQTSLAIRAPSPEADQIELITGEAAIATGAAASRPLVVIANQGRTIASHATFNIRRDGASVRLACLDGEVRVEHRNQALRVQAQQQVAYNDRGVSQLAAIDPAMVTAWQHGMLVFRYEPLAQVIQEVNRYRSGRIILLNQGLGQRPVVASFHIDRLDEVVTRIQDVFGARVTTLPGGVVLLS